MSYFEKGHQGQITTPRLRFIPADQVQNVALRHLNDISAGKYNQLTVTPRGESYFYHLLALGDELNIIFPEIIWADSLQVKVTPSPSSPRQLPLRFLEAPLAQPRQPKQWGERQLVIDSVVGNGTTAQRLTQKVGFHNAEVLALAKRQSNTDLGLHIHAGIALLRNQRVMGVEPPENSFQKLLAHFSSLSRGLIVWSQLNPGPLSPQGC